MREQLTPYPFTENEREQNIDNAMKENMLGLLATPLFDGFDRAELFDTFKTYYDYAKELFLEEEKLRVKNIPGANLHYHGRPHTVFQTPYDAITITRRVIERNDKFSAHLSPEGAIAIVGGALFHDTGYVTDRSANNHAARTPLHVEESMKMFGTAVDLLGLPEDLDKEKVKRLGKIGIHGTNFPFTTVRSVDKPDAPSRLEEAIKLKETLTPDEKKEAHIVRLAVQLADLGGQCARPDYFPNLVKKLRDELNCANPGLGTTVIGEDNELEEKKDFFVNTFVKQPQPFNRGEGQKVPSPAPNVELTARAFFGEEESKPFRNAWIRSQNTSKGF